MSGVTAQRVGDTLGGRIPGVDLSRPLDAEGKASIREALLDHLVICIPNQSLEADDLIAFGKQFGDLEPHVLSQFHHPDHANIIILSNRTEDGRPVGVADAGSYWHSDLSYMRVPALATGLYALEVPESGGDTLFANMYAAYEALPGDIRERIEGRTAIHSYSYRRPVLTEEQRRRTPDVEHPVVRTHPDTGRKALYVNPGYTTRIVGMEERASDELLEMLFSHATSPRFQYRHKWSAGDVVLWDNRCALHSATGGYTANQPRTMYRITITGSVPY